VREDRPVGGGRGIRARGLGTSLRSRPEQAGENEQDPALARGETAQDARLEAECLRSLDHECAA
jgi:hypothetical protein